MAYSLIGKRLKERDPSYLAHTNYFRMTDSEDFDVQILENVPEYSEEVVKFNLKHCTTKSWEVRSCVLDPRLFGQNVARPRRYFICWRPDKVEWVAPFSFEDVVMALRSCPTIDPLKYFWKKLPPSTLSPAQDP